VIEACSSLLDCGTVVDRELEYEDYEGARARWCPGCGDHAILGAVLRLLSTEQLQPEQTVFVSGIGCSSRFPHYVNTYGFHGLHGRALPLSTGIKLSRPDLNVFVTMGDGDCCSIGAGHWIHATRYNLNMVAMMFDNAVYGLTKNQTSPTSPQGYPSLTQPRGAYLPPLNPLTGTLGVTNASFVAQTADWVPAHLYATLLAAYRHRGFAFIRILQRCPIWTPKLYENAATNPDATEILVHENGITDPDVEAVYKTQTWHDPLDLDRARSLAEDPGAVRLGLFYRNEDNPVYEETRQLPFRTPEERMQILNAEFDRYAV